VTIDFSLFTVSLCNLDLFVTFAKEDMKASFFVRLSVCLLATLRTDFQMDLHEIFREEWTNDPDTDPDTDTDLDMDPDPYRDTGKTCLGGGVHSPSASSFRLFSRCIFCFNCILFLVYIL